MAPGSELVPYIPREYVRVTTRFFSNPEQVRLPIISPSSYTSLKLWLSISHLDRGSYELHILSTQAGGC